MTYWDPIPTVRAVAGTHLPQWEPGTRPPVFDWSRGTRSSCEPDQWGERNWRNVPGPFYGAGTDNCWTGRDCAPDNVMYDGEYNQEFVYRQPRDERETYAVLCAAECDPMAGYAGDGDAHWTPELVRDWWRDRGRVREWAVVLDRTWSVSEDRYEREASAGARDYVAHIDGGLGDYLRGYLFRLKEGRPARSGEALPAL
ncbi:ferredoxin [Streptomyces sp. ISL-44]|uniref:ferredoxin n=1 Tax=Streptomyces sp. ISL-44 TaxID=2819184 RepID=UPI0020358FA6|nr:ferredoxin [Streptomyces sp. ISL-44]